ncbi:MAG: serine acetyltransferase, partial [Pseudomonadota bacterium]
VVMPKDKAKQKKFMAYGTPDDMPDPVVRALEVMRGQMTEMAERIEELEAAREPEAEATLKKQAKG